MENKKQDESKMREYTVSVAFETRMDVVVKAKSFDDAADMIKCGNYDFTDKMWRNMDVVDSYPVNVYDNETGKMVDC